MKGELLRQTPVVVEQKVWQHVLMLTEVNRTWVDIALSSSPGKLCRIEKIEYWQLRSLWSEKSNRNKKMTKVIT